MSETPKAAPQSGADVLARVRPQLREVATEICLRPDLLEDFEAAETALAEAQEDDVAGARLAGKSGTSKKVKDLAQKVADVQQEIEETAIRFLFRAMPKDRWRSLVDSCPPRKGNEIDQIVGYDRDAAEDAAVRICLIDPVFDDESWAQLVEVINPAEWMELRASVRLANGRQAELPKSERASRILSRGARTSRPPESGE